MRKNVAKKMMNLVFATTLIVQALPVTSFATEYVSEPVISSDTSIEAQDELNSSSEDLGYEPGKILIVYDDSVSEQEVSQTVEEKDGTMVDTTNLDADTTVATVSIDANTTVQEAVDTYQEESSIKYAFPNYVMKVQDTPTDDSDVNRQYYLDSVHASESWNLMKQGIYNKTKVVVLDTGADLQNPDLVNVINIDESKEVVKTEGVFSIAPLQGDDFVNGVAPTSAEIVSHGTAIAGIIAGQANNAAGIAGVASGGNTENPFVDLVMVDVFSGVRTTNADYLLKGLEYAEFIGAKVINLSLGLNASVLDPTFNEYLQTVFDSLAQKGITVVCAAGNDSIDDCGTVQTVPSDYDSTISVVALDEDNQLADYSNFGSKKDVAASGTNVYSTYNSMTGLAYETMSGTSMACPMVTAEIAMMLSVNPKLSPSDVKTIIRETAIDLGNEGYDSTYAAGIINIESAVQRTMSDIGVSIDENVQNDNMEETKDADVNSGDVITNEQVGDSDNIETEEVPNSWRYKDGERIQIPEFHTFEVTNAWKKVNGNYINSVGSIIPGVVCRGVDVSHWNGTIDWQAAKNDDISYAIIAAGWYSSSRNAFVKDSQFDRNVSECERLGIPYGVYTYSYALNTAQAKIEAEGILNLIRGHHLSYPVYYDMEDNSQAGLDSRTLGNLAQTFCDTVKNGGYNVGIYANTNWFTNILTDSRFNNWSRWVAQYNTTCTYKGDYTMWQCSSTVSVNGIGNVDLNMDFGTTKYSTGISEGTYSFTSVLDNNKVMTLSSDNLVDGTPAVISTNASKSTQRLEIRSVGSGYYSIAFENSGKVLTVKDNSTNVGTKLEQKIWNNEKGQKWIFHNAGGYYYIESALGTYVDVTNASTEDGNVLNAYTLNHTDAQKWILSLTNEKPISDGTYCIVSKANSNLQLDVQSASMLDTANIQTYSANDTSAQRFEFEYQSNGYYKITSEQSGKALDVTGANTADNTNIQQYTWNGSNAQLWKIVKASNGDYYLKSKLGTTLSVDSNNVVTKQIAENDSQLWKFSKSSYKPIPDGVYSLLADDMKDISLDVSNASFNSGANIGVYAKNDSAAQRFEISYFADGYYKIINEQSGLSVDISDASKNSGANVQQYAWNGSNAQLWKFVESGDGKYFIKSKLGTVLTATAKVGANTTANTMGQAEEKYWTLVEEEQQLIPNGNYEIQTKLNANKTMDISGASKLNNANVQLYSSNGTSAQIFTFEYQKKGYYKITDIGSGMVLDVAGGNTSNGANVQQYKWNGSDAQLWKVLFQSDGSLVICSKLGKVLDVSNGTSRDGTNIQTFSYNGTSAQKWLLACEIKSGTSQIESCLNTNKVIDVSGANKNSGANVQLFTNNKSTAQQYIVSDLKNGYYKITAAHSDKVLDITGASSKSGTNVQQYTWNASVAQQWKFIYAGNSKYIIQSRIGTVLDVSSGSISDGANIQAYVNNNTNAQKWFLKAID